VDFVYYRDDVEGYIFWDIEYYYSSFLFQAPVRPSGVFLYGSIFDKRLGRVPHCALFSSLLQKIPARSFLFTNPYSLPISASSNTAGSEAPIEQRVPLLQVEPSSGSIINTYSRNQ